MHGSPSSYLVPDLRDDVSSQYGALLPPLPP